MREAYIEVLSVSEDKELNKPMIRNKSIIKCQILIGVLLILSCSTNKKFLASNQILKIVCEGETLENILLEGDTYPAIARENQIEAIIEYNILVEGNNIHTSIIDVNYVTTNEIKTDHKKLMLSDVFTKRLNQKLNSDCSYKITNGNYQIIIGYKLEGSNFNPNVSEFDILIRREKVKFIEQRNH